MSNGTEPAFVASSEPVSRRKVTVKFLESRVAEMDPLTLYSVLKLRTDIFVVEQCAAYPDLDDRDIEPDTRIFWAEDGAGALATLRVLAEVDGWRIGRVATASAARGQGLAAELMRRAVGSCAGGNVVLDAQQHLEHWYEAFGFSRSGEVFEEDGIPHVPMTLSSAPEMRSL